eukprot:COSAG02_NODE_919_length_15936_cov_5.055314_13_plen_61_part_00
MTATTSEPCTSIYNMSLFIFMTNTRFICEPCDVLHIHTHIPTSTASSSIRSTSPQTLSHI